jgi:NADPH2:quinone reductase
VPKSGQVLIKVMAAAMNPADNAFLKGKYSSKRTLPNSPGLEGSGIVIASGGGILAWRLKGKRVGFVTSDFSNGSWS